MSVIPVNNFWLVGDSHRHLMITGKEWEAFMDDQQPSL
jgi:hypothetical protein